MKRIVLGRIAVFALLLCSSTPLMAEKLSPETFLQHVSAHPVGDEVERDQAFGVYQALGTAPPSEIESVLPSLLQYARLGNEIHARRYATLFLSSIAMRPDGANLLSTRSEEISSLIGDSNPKIQKVALAITDYVIGRPPTNNEPYIAALKAALQRSNTQQDVAVQMVGPLLSLRSFDSGAVGPVLDFIHRNDLTANTRRELVHSLGKMAGLPEEIDVALSNELDDPDPTVRAAALVAFADSTTAFHTLSTARVQKIANDPQENAQVRDLAKQAVAGHTGLNPNLDLPLDKPKDQ